VARRLRLFFVCEPKRATPQQANKVSGHAANFALIPQLPRKVLTVFIQMSQIKPKKMLCF
jgi:hypothetical protein